MVSGRCRCFKVMMPSAFLMVILWMSGTTQAQKGVLNQVVDLRRLRRHSCEDDPASCAWKVKCPGLGMVVKNGILKPHGENGTISQQECLDAMQNGLKVAPETAWLVCLDALFQHVDVFDLPSNHIGNTGIRTNGYINKSAFENLWDLHSSNYGDERLMCRADMKRAADFNRQAVSYPGFDTKVFFDWRGTVFGKPIHRDIAPLTMVGMAKLFGKMISTTDGDKYCLNKNDLASIYLENKFPREPRQMSEFDILADASFAGGIANAQWHIPMMRVVYSVKAIEGTLPPNSVFNNRAILAMWLTGTLDWREILLLVLLLTCFCCFCGCAGCKIKFSHPNRYTFDRSPFSDSQKEEKGPTLLGGRGVIKKGKTGEAEALLTTECP